MLVGMQYLAVLRQGIVPLLQIDIRLGLQQMQVKVIGVAAYLGVEHFERITPVLPRLRRGGMRNEKGCD